MRKTTFIGLTALDPEDSLFADNAAFTTRDRDEIDRALKIGVKTHRHTGEAGLENPSKSASASIIPSAGTIEGGLTITVGYTLEDSSGGETLVSPLSVVSTPSPMEVPLNAPVAVVSYTEGTLLTDTYTYAITYTDGEGGETPLGPSTLVSRNPGFEKAQIELSGLTTGMEAAGANGWRLYRARGGGSYVLLATGDTSEDEYVDDGSVSPNCDEHPPTDNENTTGKINTLEVLLPSGGVIGEAAFINLYATLSNDFGESSLLAQYPVASAGQNPTFTSLDFLDSQPPDVNRSYGGAPKIEPETELLDFHWKRPVTASANLPSGEVGDVRLAEKSGRLYAVLPPLASTSGPSGWTQIASGLGGRAWASATIGPIASGAYGSGELKAGQSAMHMIKLSTNKRSRVRVYGDKAAQAADITREIGTDPTGDHGVQLDYAATAEASGSIARITPVIHAVNLDDPPKNVVYLTVDNFDETGNVTVAFLYLPMEGV